MELKIEQRERLTVWACYVDDGREHAGMVNQLRNSPREYYCDSHLAKAIQDGELRLVQGVGKLEDVASGEVTGVTLPVTAHDDGSVTVGEVDIRWD